MRLLGLNAAQQMALLRLRARLTVRRFSREPGSLVGMIILALTIIPAAVGVAAATGIGYLRLPAPWPGQLLGGVLVALWLIWIAASLLAYRPNEGLHVERLLVYPMRSRDLVAAQVLGTLFDLPTYFMLPLFVAILIGWGTTPALPVVLIALPLSYAHMVLGSQLVLVAVGGILSSRRFRDLAVVIFTLLGSSCWFLQQGFFKFGQRYVSPDLLATFRPLDFLQWLPTGAAARAIERAAAGAWGASLLWLLYAGVLLVFVAWAWWRLLLRLVTGEGFLFVGARQPEKPVAPRRRKQPVFGPLALVPADIRQLVLKELTLLWRIPSRRIGLLQGFFLPVVFGLFFFVTTDVPETMARWAGLGLVLYSLFFFWGAGQNMLGVEGHGLPTLLLTPVPRERIFLAKGLALGGIGGVLLLILGVVSTILSPGWTSVAGLLAGMAVAAVSLGVCAVASVLFPYPMNLESTTRKSAFGGGGSCLAGLVNALLLPVIMGALSLPVAGPLAAGMLLDLPWLGVIGSILASVYGALLFWFGIRLAGRLLLEREPEVLAATRPLGAGV